LLEYDEGEEDERDVTLHGLRHSTLTGAQSGQLLSVAEAGLDVPATALAPQQDLPAPMEIVADNVVQSSVTVCGHDESDDAVSREMHGADPGPRAARDAVAGKTLCPLLDRLGAAVVGNPGIALERTDPDDLVRVQPLRERPGIVPEVEGQVLEGQTRAQHVGNHGLRELQLGAVRGKILAFGAPQAEAHGNAQRLIAPKQQDDVKAKDMALPRVRVRPSCPSEQLGEGLLHHDIVQAQIARTPLALHPPDQGQDQLMRRPGQDSQEPVQGIMRPAWQHRRDPHCGLALLQQNEPGHVQGHHLNYAARPASPHLQYGDRSFNLLPQAAGASIQPGHHEGSALPDVCLVVSATQSFRQAVSFIFSAPFQARA
jgi:hypothetical protein